MTRSPTWTVIGAGLAGTLTCLELVRRRQRVQWIHEPDRPAASTVAAGMYNPITGRRFAKTWQVDILQPFMERYYKSLEQETGTRFLFPQPVMKLFTAPGERDRWEARNEDPDFKKLARNLSGILHPAGVRDVGLGGFIVPRAGSLRVTTLLKALRRKLAAEVDMIEETVSPERSLAGNVIHCTGWRSTEHPLLHGLPFRHAHGDLLTIEAPGLEDTYILNAGVYILPLGGDRFKVGSTYDWDRLNPAPTEHGRKELEDRLDELLHIPYRVLDHSAGIRPATKRRTPILGRLPHRTDQIIFNGLGSKGVLLAPYYAQHLVEHLLDDRPLDREVDILTHLRKAPGKKT